MNNPTVKEIIIKFLMENGYDGLYNEYLECGCRQDDLLPCEFFDEDCKAGFKMLNDEGHWCIYSEKPMVVS